MTIPTLIPRKAIFGNPTRLQPAISPDGRLLAFIAPKDDVLNIWVAPIENPKNTRCITNDTKRGIRQFDWTYNNQIVYIQDKNGDEDWQTYLVDIETAQERNLTPFAGTTSSPIKFSLSRPNEMLIMMNKRDPTVFDLYLVNLTTAELEMVEENTGKFSNWHCAGDLKAHLTTQEQPDGGKTILQKNKNTGAWEPIFTWEFSDAVSDCHSLNKDGTKAYLLDCRGRDNKALVELDLTSQDKPLRILGVSSNTADIKDLLKDPKTGSPIAFTAQHATTKWHVLDTAYKNDFEYLEETFTGEIDIASQSLDNTKWVINQTTASGVQYHIYDRGTTTVTFLFHSNDELLQYTLNNMHPVVIKSRDGQDLVSYLTIPDHLEDPERPGRPIHPIPLVLRVHGGPWWRDSYGFNPEHQWLSNRGFAVLSVNFRGSTGFGKTFVDLGNSQWSKDMHTDLIDGVEWAITEQIAIREKVAIYGGSYGGYSTLAGLTFTPDVFCCGVDIVGPSNLITLMETIPPYWSSFYQEFLLRIGGDPKTEEGRKFLMECSPLTHVDKIKKPLLIGQGANDPRVKQAESDQIVEAMVARKIPVGYVLFSDEGHGFARPPNKIAFNAISERFLSNHLGGRHEPHGNVFEGSTANILQGKEDLLE
ncbi:MAG: aminopeptidase [Linnemannia gamsii]|nr:MAG: aminopeptidase [Linnemannia gamsii]